VRYDEFPLHLAGADVVVASTASPHPIVSKQMVADALRTRAKNRPLYMIDIAVPRDIEPAAGDLDGVYLFDLDHLHQIVETEAAERRQKATRAETIVHEEAVACAMRLRTAQVAGPLVTDVRAWHNSIIQEELQKLKRKLPALATDDSEKMNELLDGFARTLENKLAHAPTERIKEYATWEDENLAARKMRTVRELFGLEEQPADTERAKP
jgi:glutamyl-tRNA reductase